MCSFPYHLAPISRTISRLQPISHPLPPITRTLPPSRALSLSRPPSPHTASTSAPVPTTTPPHGAWRAFGPDPHPENMIGPARRAPHHVNRCGGRPRPIHRPRAGAAACLYLTGCGPLHTMGLSAIRPEGSPPQPTAPHCSPHQMAHALYACLPRPQMTLPGEPAPRALSRTVGTAQAEATSRAPVRHAPSTPARLVRGRRSNRRSIQPRYAPLVRRIFATTERRHICGPHPPPPPAPRRARRVAWPGWGHTPHSARFRVSLSHHTRPLWTRSNPPPSRLAHTIPLPVAR